MGHLRRRDEAEAKRKRERFQLGQLGGIGGQIAPETITRRAGVGAIGGSGIRTTQNTVAGLRGQGGVLSGQRGSLSGQGGIAEIERLRGRVGKSTKKANRLAQLTSERVAVRGEFNEGRITATGPNFFSGAGQSLQPEGFNLGLFDFLGIEEENERRIERNKAAQKGGGGKAGKARRREIASGARQLEPLLAQPSLRRQKLSPGGTVLTPATLPEDTPPDRLGSGGIGRSSKRSTAAQRKADKLEAQRRRRRGIGTPG